MLYKLKSLFRPTPLIRKCIDYLFTCINVCTHVSIFLFPSLPLISDFSIHQSSIIRLILVSLHNCCHQKSKVYAKLCWKSLCKCSSCMVYICILCCKLKVIYFFRLYNMLNPESAEISQEHFLPKWGGACGSGGRHETKGLTIRWERKIEWLFTRCDGNQRHVGIHSGW